MTLLVIFKAQKIKLIESKVKKLLLGFA